MTAGLFDKGRLGIPCLGCGEKNEKTINWIKANDQLTCEGCGETITLKRDKLLDGLEQVGQSMADFQKTLKGFGKRR